MRCSTHDSGGGWCAASKCCTHVLQRTQVAAAESGRVHATSDEANRSLLGSAIKRRSFQHVEILTAQWPWMLCSWLSFAQVSLRFSMRHVSFLNTPRSAEIKAYM